MDAVPMVVDDAPAYDGQDPAVRHTPPHHGYAQLVGSDFTFILRDTKLQLGRKMPVEKPGVLGISLSTSQANSSP